MVNGNYVSYGDRPSSESEIVDDHVHTRTVEKKNKRKCNRTANELQHSLNQALDNETDSVKYEKKIKEPRLLRYVPTTEVEENYVTEKFETYDLKPTEEPPRRYAFTKKTKNPLDGSVNYAYSRSSSNCSSPNGNLPTIAEHEQFSTFRVRPQQKPIVNDVMEYENKLDKYFARPREVKKFAAKGSHPDSLYRVSAGGGDGSNKLSRILRMLRWPTALIVVCVALALFVYFLMPDHIDRDQDSTFWEASMIGATNNDSTAYKNIEKLEKLPGKSPHPPGSKTPEIDFYDAVNDKNVDVTSIVDSITETSANKKLPIAPVFPTHIAPEVQYGDTDKLRTPKLVEKTNKDDDSTLRPHITLKPEKPLAVYFNDAKPDPAPTNTETITRAETINANYDDRPLGNRNIIPAKPFPYKELTVTAPKESKVIFKQPIVVGHELSQNVQEVYKQIPANVDVNFTSGHSKIFGISIEDAEKMRSTTQSSLYKTRVSPTLPTWRDGEEATTKKYPVNFNTDVPQCRSTRLALCRDVLPYDLAGPPAKLGGVDVTILLPQIEFMVVTNCSARIKQFACALLEPECSPPPKKLPCYNLCRAITDSCTGLIPAELAQLFNCKKYSKRHCVNAVAPCKDHEVTCGDGSCISRDWVCDGNNDCPSGEDESICSQCDATEFRCPSGGCILKRWVCDGYADCPNQEDETEEVCNQLQEIEKHDELLKSDKEPGEESAGSAPAPSVRRPHHILSRTEEGDGDSDNSKELMMTSDSTNALKRNFTRRLSLSRLTPYSRPIPKSQKEDDKHLTDSQSTVEDIGGDDLELFDEVEKYNKDRSEKKRVEQQKRLRHPKPILMKATTSTITSETVADSLDNTLSKLERVINTASFMNESETKIEDSPENKSNPFEDFPISRGYSSHTSPCPVGELRCVDGRCITLSQLCDGIIDCTDNADEDNCST